MSFEAQRGQIDAFDEEIIALKPHPGMQQVGINLRALLDGSEVIAGSKGIRTQDALSIRSIPQVHGAARDQVEHATRQIETELNSATDNPLVLGTPDDYRVVSQANPHGQSVALAADMLAIAMAEIGSMAERRLDRLINPHVSGLPAFPGEQSRGQLRDDDHAVRRGVPVRAKPPAGTTCGTRQLRHLRLAGRPPEHGHQRRTQAAPGAGQRAPRFSPSSTCWRPRRLSFSRTSVLARAPTVPGVCCVSRSRLTSRIAGWHPTLRPPPRCSKTPLCCPAYYRICTEH